MKTGETSPAGNASKATTENPGSENQSSAKSLPEQPKQGETKAADEPPTDPIAPVDSKENTTAEFQLAGLKVGYNDALQEIDELRKENSDLLQKNKSLLAQLNALNEGKTITTSAKAAPVTASAPGAKLEPKPGFVIAERDGEQTYFSNESWDLLGASKAGWHKATPIPKEVEEMRASNS